MISDVSRGLLEPTETSKMELFGKIVHSFLFLIVFAKHSILDVSQGSDYTYEFNSNSP